MNETPREPNPERVKDFTDEYFAAAEALKKTRPGRRVMNFLAVACFVGAGLFAWGMSSTKQHEWIWFIGLAICGAGFAFAVQSYKGATRCPRCRQDFTRYTPVSCHVCGNRLENKECKKCAVNWRWDRILGRPSDTTGNGEKIGFCPGCGVFIDSEHYRADAKRG